MYTSLFLHDLHSTEIFLDFRFFSSLLSRTSLRSVGESVTQWLMVIYSEGKTQTRTHISIQRLASFRYEK